MRRIYSYITSLIFINIFSKIICQSTDKYFITSLNYSLLDNIYYIQLYLNEEEYPKKFIIDTTFSFIASYINNITDLSNCLNDNNNEECLVNSQIIIDNKINKDINKESDLFTFNADILYYSNISNFYYQKNFNKNYDNIGLNNNNQTIVDILYNLNIIDEKIFSIYFSKTNGYLSFGRINRDEQEINFINILSSLDNYYELKINYIKINNIKIENEYISYLDTSKSSTYFPKNLYEQIIANLLFKNNILKEESYYGFCATVNKNEKNNFYLNFHDIIINFENYDFIWKSKNYFNEYNTINNDEIKLCLTFKELNNDDNNNKIIFGTDFMSEYEIIFDKNNKKIAFINNDNFNIFSKNINNTNREIINIDSNKIIDSINNTEKNENINTNSISIENEEENDEEEIEEEKEKDNTNNMYETLKAETQSYEYESDENTIINKEKSKSSQIVDDKYILNYSINPIDNAYNSENLSESSEYSINTSTLENNILETTQYNHDIKEREKEKEKEREKDKDKEREKEREKDKENKVDTTEKIIETTESIKKIDITIIPQKVEINIKPTTTEIKIPTTIINEENKDQNNITGIKNIDINIIGTELISNKILLTNETQIVNPTKKSNGFANILKSFLKNKLIYFFLALFGVILSFVSIIFFSCAIISCVKYIKRIRRDYMEQIDVEIQKDSKNYSYSDRI